MDTSRTGSRCSARSQASQQQRQSAGSSARGSNGSGGRWPQSSIRDLGGCDGELDLALPRGFAKGAPSIRYKRETSQLGGGRVMTFTFNSVGESPQEMCRKLVEDALLQDDYNDLKDALEKCKDASDLSCYMVPNRDVARLMAALRKHILREIGQLQAQRAVARQEDADKLEKQVSAKIAELKIYGASSPLLAKVSGAQGRAS